VIDDNLTTTLAFVVPFLGGVFGLLFLLAWLEQPASERWWPAWWVKHQAVMVSRPTAHQSGAQAVGSPGPGDGVATPRARR
jgi:hypothetical protein